MNDIEYWIKDNQHKCLANATKVTEYEKQLELGHLCFCGHGQETVWYRSSSDKPAGPWDHTARKMTQKIEEASHPIFHCAEPFLQGDLKSKKGMQTIPFQSTTQTTTTIIRTILACNRSCIYDAVCVWFSSVPSKQRSWSS